MIAAMKRDAAIAMLRRHRTQLKALGVGGLYLYGSVARDEAGEDSDVDILIDPASERFSIFDLAHVQDRCAAILGVPAEAHDFDGLRRLPEFRKRVERDLVRVF
jgi:hypothetical protein